MINYNDALHVKYYISIVLYCWSVLSQQHLKKSTQLVTIGNNTMRGHFVGVDEIKDGSQLKLKVKIDNYYLAIKFFLVNLYFKAVYFKQL